MEIKGEQIYLTSGEIAQTGFKSPINIGDVPSLANQNKADKDVDADNLSGAALGQSLLARVRINERGFLLDKITEELARKDSTPEQELEQLILRG